MSKTDDLARAFIDLFGAINRNLIREPEDSVKATNPGQSALLFVLYKKGALNMSALGKYLAVSRPNITFLVDKLEKKGMICRVRDKKDRRIINIQLETRGRDFVEKRQAFIEGRIKNKLKRLSGHDLTFLKDSVDQILAILAKLYDPDKNED